MTAEEGATQRACEACGSPLSVYNRGTVCSGCARHKAPVEEPADWLRRPEPVPPENSGAVIRAWRTASSHNQAETAELLGMTQQNLSQIENGRQLMSYEQRQRAVATLGIPAVELGLSPGRPRAEVDVDVAEDQERWRQERWWLNRHRSELADLAARLYPAESRVAGTTLIAADGWLPREPLPLRSLSLTLDESAHPVDVDGGEPETAAMRPLYAPDRRFDRYTAAVRHLDPPRLFEARTSYRLLSESLASGELEFGLASYFDKLDVSEALGHELARASMRYDVLPRSADDVRDELPFRALVGDPFDPKRRAITPAVTTLTVRLRRFPAEPTFLLHWRDPTKVATAAGVYDVIPAGEFQPASVAPWDRYNDFDIWRNVVREYSEELLGTPEHDGTRSTPIDYESWPLYRELQAAQEAGSLSSHVLGLGVDALTLAATILTVVVIDDDVFAGAFDDATRYNEEGEIVAIGDGRATEGVPFTSDSIQRLLRSEPMAAPGAACLALAWRHRDLLLG